MRINFQSSTTALRKIIKQKVPRIYVLHENEEWVEPLRESFKAMGLPFTEWYIHEGSIDLNAVPPQGVFYNRMSASSHTRGHRYSIELAAPILAWLEAHGRRVVNNRRALQLEVRKFEQYIELQSFGLRTPKTVATVGNEQLLNAAKEFEGQSFITKPNRGGKGLGVQLFHSVESLEAFLSTQKEPLSLDGVVLLQEYIEPAEGKIVRLEFIGGKFYYAVEVDASGGFELCPADACEVGDAFCPTTDAGPRFRILDEFLDSDISKMEDFLAYNGIEIAAIEFVQDKDGKRYLYDMNTNTNYNSKAELSHGKGLSGMDAIAEFLGKELSRINESTKPTYRLAGNDL